MFQKSVGRFNVEILKFLKKEINVHDYFIRAYSESDGYIIDRIKYLYRSIILLQCSHERRLFFFFSFAFVFLF